MLEPFKSGKLLVARAQEHFNQFNTTQSGLVAQKPYSFFSDVDPQTGETRCKVKVSSDLGDRLPVIAFDIVNCLRSSLDHVVFDSARVLGANPDPIGTKFPFGKSADDAAKNLDRYKENQVPPVIRPFLLGFEPYQGGKEAIWELNELRKQKIHRVLQAIAAHSGGVTFNEGFIGNMSGSVSSVWDHDKGELTFMRIRPGARMNVEIDPMISIGFGDVSLFGMTSAVEVFGNLLKVVERILLGVETETVRLST